jgi:signal transduction histidine kinase
MSLRNVVDRTLSEVRLEAGQQRRARLPVVAFIDEIAATGMLHSEYRNIRFTVDAIDPALSIDADPQLLASAVMNLLNNAFKNTPSGGNVVLRAGTEAGRLLIETEDECGGIPQSEGDLFQEFGDRRASDRSGRGLGLSIARTAVRAHGGDIRIRNIPGKGCIFIIDLPLAPQESVPEAVA